MFRKVVLFSVFVFGISEIIFANLEQEVRRRRIQQHVVQIFNLPPNHNDFFVQRPPVVQGPIQIQRDLELGPYIKDCIFDTFKKIDDAGHYPVICCACGIWCFTENPCVAVSAVATCGAIACISSCIVK